MIRYGDTMYKTIELDVSKLDELQQFELIGTIIEFMIEEEVCIKISKCTR